MIKKNIVIGASFVLGLSWYAPMQAEESDSSDSSSYSSSVSEEDSESSDLSSESTSMESDSSSSDSSEVSSEYKSNFGSLVEGPLYTPSEVADFDASIFMPGIKYVYVKKGNFCKRLLARDVNVVSRGEVKISAAIFKNSAERNEVFQSSDVLGYEQYVTAPSISAERSTKEDSQALERCILHLEKLEEL